MTITLISISNRPMPHGIYGLELEDLLSQTELTFLFIKNTLIEEHILGIPGDVFIKKHLSNCTELEKAQISKEFVKFNERLSYRPFRRYAIL